MNMRKAAEQGALRAKKEQEERERGVTFCGVCEVGRPGEVIRVDTSGRCEVCGRQVNGKSTNPKQAFGDAKVPLHLVPDTAVSAMAIAMLDGALKYGTYNWRDSGVRVSTYVAAARRHLADYWNGEEVAPDGVHHLWHAMACLAIVIDSKAVGNLNDDRPLPAPVREFMDELASSWIETLKRRHRDKSPPQLTIADARTKPA